MSAIERSATAGGRPVWHVSATGDRRISPLMAAKLSTVSVGAVLAVLLSAHWGVAGPDPCKTYNTSNGTETYCEGNQSAGVDTDTDKGATNKANILEVTGLTTTIAPKSGVAGIKHFINGQGGQQGTFFFLQANGQPTDGTINSVGASGINLRSQGSNGSNGGYGKNGSSGTSLGPVITTTAGTISTDSAGNADTISGLVYRFIGGNGGKGGDPDGGGGDGGYAGDVGSNTLLGQGRIQVYGGGDEGSAVHMVIQAGNGGGGGDAVFGNGGTARAGGSIPGQVSVGPRYGDWTLASSHRTGGHALHVEHRAGSGGGGGSGNKGAQGGAGGDALIGRIGGNPVGLILWTAGLNSHGLFYEGVGGNGGQGGLGDTKESGPGGNAGLGPTISPIFSGNLTVTTGSDQTISSGDGSIGVFIASQGGNGGNAGDSAFGNGDSGGRGGNGGPITMRHDGGNLSVTTQGAGAHGVVLGSIGGSGGTGGNSGSVNNGGVGGAGGIGGAVSFSDTAGSRVRTMQDDANAIVIHSSGGPGGQGGNSSNIWGGGGGDGGTAGYAGPVTVNVYGTIDTYGADSIGVIAQSIGGKAGSGGSASGLINFGANAGSAGAGEKVVLFHDGETTTRGNQSAGLVAQSIGGGGGHGGSGFGVYYGEGGTGSAGGQGFTVEVRNTGFITTGGNDSHGIQAQSIGGTGGDGGSGTSLIAALGGGASASSAGGEVQVTNEGPIVTGLDPPSNESSDTTCGTGCSHGVMAQSIGGGGGNGGSAVGWFSMGGAGGGGGAGGSVSVENFSFATNRAASIDTYLDASSAIYAQSVGGGGGHGSGSVAISGAVSVAIGGSGGDGGNGGKVTVTPTRGSQLTTRGDDSDGVFAQSVGGGGGRGGFAASLSLNPLVSASVAVGGTGGGGGGGESVNVSTLDNTYTGPVGSISTQGANSRGIFAQSVGGGGGNGGFSIAGAAGGEVGSLVLSVGGSGGAGGDGQRVSVTSDVTIATTGEKAEGIFAQSVGGGGGAGGLSIAGAISLEGAAIAASFGGSGGVGGLGRDATVTNLGDITTTGLESDGILAQSIGGGGGTGGLSIAGAVNPGGFAAAFSHGGDGGSGSSAQLANVDNLNASSTIKTSGDKAHGIFAQSVGGGGGKGGLSVAGTIDGLFGAGVTFGGSGAGGGNGGKADVDNLGTIITEGSNASGIFAQSVGGGGGQGGASISGTLSGPDSKSVFVSHGGSGGSGSSGGEVTVTNSGAITTGDLDADDDHGNSHGIFAQSVGGGGGNGGLSGAFTLGALGAASTLNVTVAVGGQGGSAGKGGAVEVINQGGSNAITTYSPQSHAIFAQSVGGSGGNGGGSMAASVEVGKANESSTMNVSVAVGGKGGDGSAGGDVTVTNTSGTLETWGSSSHGIYAHSVGGSGGAGGSSTSLSFNLKNAPGSEYTGKNYNFDIGVGGSGGEGTHGGVVLASSDGGDISTHGDNSMGIYAYSIGGGGGDGGDAGNFPTIPQTDRVDTFKDLNIQVGGGGGGSGDGGAVNASLNAGNVRTDGLMSPGIYAQSVGGGGGRGGTGAVGYTGKLSIGGGGGSAGNGESVNVYLGSNTSVVTTSNVDDPDNALKFDGTDITPADIDGSYGVFAQSVGGGGGQAGNAVLQTIPFVNTDVSIGIGYALAFPGGNAGNGGPVAVAAEGATIETQGTNGFGLFAQSIGGGGGIAGDVGIGPGTAVSSTSNVLVGSIGGDGIGGHVEVSFQGDIRTHGDAAHGIFAQSAGGTAAVTNSRVDVSVDGSVVVSGTDATGILAQSVRLGDNGNATGADNITVSVAGGSMVQGGVDSYGVHFSQGVSNTLTNAGTITTLGETAVLQTGSGELEIDNTGQIIPDPGADGTAIAYGAAPRGFALDGLVRPGKLQVRNAGTITGSILGEQNATGAVTLDNHAGGTVNAGTRLDVDRMTNRGVLTTHGAGTRIAGDFIQGPGGTTVMTVTGAGDAALDIEGDADIAGEILVDLAEADVSTLFNPTPGRIGLMRAGGTLSLDKELRGPVSAAAQYALVPQASGRVDLKYDIDFANAAIRAVATDNQERLAFHLEQIWELGVLAAEAPEETRQLLSVESAEDYVDIGESLSGEAYANTQLSALRGSDVFGRSLLSCSVRHGEMRFSREGQCGWLFIGGTAFDQDDNDVSGGFDQTSFVISGGTQIEVEPDMFLGFGVAYENVSIDMADASTDGDVFRLGLSLKRQFGPASLSAALSTGFGSYDVTRSPDVGGSASGSQDIWTFSGRVRGAYRFEQGDWFATPRLDLGIDHVSADGLDEGGNGVFRLSVDDSSETYVSLSPAVELGGEWAMDDGTLIRPSLTLGLTHYLSNGPSVRSAFSIAPASASSAEAKAKFDRTYLDVGIGLDVITSDRMSLSLTGATTFSENSSSYGAGLRAQWRF